MDDSEQAVLDWLHTFEAGAACTELSQLKTGVILAEILHEIVPEFFEVDQYNRTEDNWAIAAGNLRMLIKSLDEYFTTVLQKRIDTSGIHVNEIARSSSSQGQLLELLIELLELIVGVAVLCEHKAVFIQNIFSLNLSSQGVLKALVEQVLSHAADILTDDSATAEEVQEGDGEDPRPSTAEEVEAEEEVASAEEVRSLREQLQHMHRVSATASADKQALEQALYGLQREVERLRGAGDDSNASKAQGADREEQLEAMVRDLHRELDESKSAYDRSCMEVTALKAEGRAQLARAAAAQEVLVRLEMENTKYADEVDILRDKLSHYASLEAQMEKYRAKLEALATMRSSNRDLTARLDGALDKIAELEGANRALLSYQKAAEGQRARMVELDREKMEAASKALILEEALAAAKDERLRAANGSRQLQQEVQRLTEEVAALTALLREHKQRQAADDSFDTSSSPSSSSSADPAPLRERIRLLEAELHSLRGAGAGAASSTSSEVEDLRALKAEADKALHAASRSVFHLTAELAEARAVGSASDASAQQLLIHKQTIAQLESKLLDKENAINKLEQDKSKLETYTRRSLHTFKDKFMSVLTALKDEKKEVEVQLQLQLTKFNKLQGIYAKEERLLSSALFEIGVKVMDMNIHAQLLEQQQPSGAGAGAGAASPFLVVQREALRAAGDWGLNRSPIHTVGGAAAPTTPMR